MFSSKTLCPCRPGELLFDHHPIAKGIQLALISTALNLHPVGAPMAKAGVCQSLLQAAVGGEEEQPFAVGVQTTCRINIRNSHPVGKAAPSAARFRCELAEDSVWLVKQKCQECSPKQIKSASPQVEASLM